MSIEIKEIKIQYSDMTTTLSYDEKEQTWVRIVRGTKEAPCFACTTMDIDDMEVQLEALMCGIREQAENKRSEEKDQ